MPLYPRPRRDGLREERSPLASSVGNSVGKPCANLVFSFLTIFLTWTERESEFLPLLNSKDKVTLQELYDEMFMKRSSGPLYIHIKDNLKLQRIEKGINRNSNGENFIPDYSKSQESSLSTLRYESFVI